MIYIAQRGLIDGPDKGKENNPKQIQYAVSQGFECRQLMEFTMKEKM